jgi:hypothetical protein
MTPSDFIPLGGAVIGIAVLQLLVDAVLGFLAGS